MARRWRELRRNISKWAANVGALVSHTASLILRRSNRQVGVENPLDTLNPLLICKLNKYEDDLDKIPDVYDSHDLISVDSHLSQITDDFSSVLVIPYDCRIILYEYVDYPDVLRLRLTCKQIYYELSYCRGLRVKLDDTIIGYDWFKHTGVGSLTVRHFRSDLPENYTLLKRPQLLKELVITGSILSDNFNWIISTCLNLQKFAVEISPYSVRNGCQSFYADTLMPKNLRTLRLSAFMYDHHDAQNTSDNLFPILNNIKCPHLNQFIFQLVIIDTQSLDDFHIEALKFIRAHSKTLQVLQVQIKQVFVALHSNENPYEDLFFSQWVDQLELKELKLTLDRHISKWLPILHAPSKENLANLELNLRNFKWSTIFPVLKHCGRSLKNLQVYNLNVREGHRAHPIDLGVLRHCLALEKLTLYHQEHSPIFNPKISRTAYLPCSLTEIDLSRIFVKQHQLLFIFIRLPKVKKIELAFWSDTESYFASLFSLIPLLIRFNITSVKSVILTDLRRKFENRKSELTRMTNFLCGLATVSISEAVRETRVSIDVKSFHDDECFQNCNNNYCNIR